MARAEASTAPAGDARAGQFVTLEGGEGAGKSTQLARLAHRLRSLGHEVVATREPGGTEGAEAIRGLLVGGAIERWSPLAESFLHIAARIDHLERVIRPGLARGAWVLCDRFLDSTRVYQGMAGQLGVDPIDRLHEIALGESRPNLTLLFDLEVDVGLARSRPGRQEDRYERMGRTFHEQVRRGYLDLAAREPGRFAVIDAGMDPAAVETAIWATLRERLDPGLPT